MIAKLTGILDSKFSNFLIIDISGVGYKVFCTESFLLSSAKGDSLTIYIETIVREDAFNLYGFKSPIEKEWFNLLISVQGVGPKAGMVIISSASTNDMYTAIAANDVTIFTKAQGIGPKIAKRIVAELKVKSQKLMGSINSEGISYNQEGISNFDNKNSELINDIVSALMSLGYNKVKAFSVAGNVLRDNKDISLDNALKEALKLLN